MLIKRNNPWTIDTHRSISKKSNQDNQGIVKNHITLHEMTIKFLRYI